MFSKVGAQPPTGMRGPNQQPGAVTPSKPTEARRQPSPAGGKFLEEFLSAVPSAVKTGKVSVIEEHGEQSLKKSTSGRQLGVYAGKPNIRVVKSGGSAKTGWAGWSIGKKIGAVLLGIMTFPLSLPALLLSAPGMPKAAKSFLLVLSSIILPFGLTFLSKAARDHMSQMKGPLKALVRAFQIIGSAMATVGIVVGSIAAAAATAASAAAIVISPVGWAFIGVGIAAVVITVIALSIRAAQVRSERNALREHKDMKTIMDNYELLKAKFEQLIKQAVESNQHQREDSLRVAYEQWKSDIKKELGLLNRENPIIDETTPELLALHGGLPKILVEEEMVDRVNKDLETESLESTATSAEFIAAVKADTETLSASGEVDSKSLPAVAEARKAKIDGLKSKISGRVNTLTNGTPAAQNALRYMAYSQRADELIEQLNRPISQTWTINDQFKALSNLVLIDGSRRVPAGVQALLPFYYNHRAQGLIETIRTGMLTGNVKQSDLIELAAMDHVPADLLPILGQYLTQLGVQLPPPYQSPLECLESGRVDSPAEFEAVNEYLELAKLGDPTVTAALAEVKAEATRFAPQAVTVPGIDDAAIDRLASSSYIQLRGEMSEESPEISKSKFRQTDNAIIMALGKGDRTAGLKEALKLLSAEDIDIEEEDSSLSAYLLTRFAVSPEFAKDVLAVIPRNNETIAPAIYDNIKTNELVQDFVDYHKTDIDSFFSPGRGRGFEGMRLFIDKLVNDNNEHDFHDAGVEENELNVRPAADYDELRVAVGLEVEDDEEE